MTHTPLDRERLRKKYDRREYIITLALRTLGNFLILSSLFFIAKTFYQPLREELRYNLDQFTHKTYVVAEKQNEAQVKGLLAKTLNGADIQVLTPVDPNFSVVIPKIDANARIIENVDVSNPDIYLAALKKGVAQAEGTAFPGEGGHIYLFAHSTDYIWNVGTYNAVFYLLYKLGVGDEINLFYKGQRYVYRVIGTKIVDPSEVSYITRKTNKEFLTLQTCWPPGTTLKRLLVFATREAE